MEGIKVSIAIYRKENQELEKLNNFTKFTVIKGQI